MKMNLGLLVASVSLALQGPALAQDSAAGYPSKPVRIVVGYQAGGPTDVAARLLATKLHAALGQPFVVDNKPGAGSNVASELVAVSRPDGYTLLLAAAPITMNGFLYKKLKWDVQKSFEPISMVMSAPAVLAVAPNLPARNLQELLDLARAKPGELSFGSTGNGGSQHVAGEQLKTSAGVDLVHVPYKGASGAVQDLMAGQISMAFMTAVSAVPFIKSGKVRPIAVAASKRLKPLADVPTMAEAGLPGFESDSWNGLFAPKGTPAAIVEKLHAAVASAVATPDLRDKLESEGAVMVGNSPTEFANVISQEVDQWSELLPKLNLKMD
jgi:tripartite-type tricarboxylate transporter receptor subunit TctC